MKLVAGVDTSTQSCKVRVTDAGTGAMVRFGQARHPDGSSINPDYWWTAFLEAAEQAGGLADVEAIAVGGQQHGMVLLDRQGRVIRDALLWNDTSSAPQAAALIDDLGRLPFADDELDDPILAGMVATVLADGGDDALDDPAVRGRLRWVRAVGSSPVASYTLTKVRWVAEHEPENAAKIAAICLPHDWLTWRIAGYGPVADGEEARLDRLVTDRSDASGTLYFDAASGEYRRDLLAMAFGTDPATGRPTDEALAIAGSIVLPAVLGPTAVAGVIGDDSHEEVAPTVPGAAVNDVVIGSATTHGCLIGPGGGDNAMASLGLGMEVGDVSISLGTSGVVAAVSPTPVYDPSGSVSGFADCTGHFLPLACTINGSKIIDAGRAVLDVDYAEFDKLALSSRPGAGGLKLVPYFDGERTPNLPDATGTLSGMTMANMNRPNFARAFVEGMLGSQRYCLDLIRSLGAPIDRLLMIGGGARGAATRSIAPLVFEMPVELPPTDEYVAIGAAKQAASLL
ncbi:xylulose kinase [Bifidobacterium sp. BRDM6]|uniref:Xylulose kinase n=1 Tax=Bifidobacterium choloepi TaxID=2614131 RepID=A0A6I5MZ18_9BIFI|nr:xylulose kinase [Bifidobacterium choloepi]